MTRKRFIRRRRVNRWNSESSKRANKARWDAERARVDAGVADRIRELEEIETINLPRRQGDALGCLQWHDFREGKVRKWTIRIGDRADRITVESPGGSGSRSHGWTWFLTQLRKHLS